MKSFYSLFFILLGYLPFSAQLNNADDLYNYAKENSPTLKNANLDVDLAEEKIKQTISSGLPKVNGGLGFQNYIDIPTTVVPATAFNPSAPEGELLGLNFGTDYNANYNIKVDQLLFSFTYIYGIKAAKTYRELSHLLKLKQHEDLYENIKLNLGNYIFLSKSKEIIKRNEDEIKILIEKTNSLIDNGFIEKTTINDLLLIALELKAAANDLEANRTIVEINLKSTIGYPLDSSLSLLDSFNKNIYFIESSALDAKNSSAFRIGEQNLAINKIGLKASKSEGYPSIYGFFSHQQMAMRNQFNFFDNQAPWYPATLWGFNITIPIFNSGEGKSKTQQKLIAVEKANNELIEIENQIVALQMILKNNYKTAFLRYENCKQKLGYSDETYKKELIKYKNGASNLLILTEKKSILIQTEQELVQKEFELFTAEVQLEKYTKPLAL
jgi:outer membrane protein TolC